MFLWTRARLGHVPKEVNSTWAQSLYSIIHSKPILFHLIHRKALQPSQPLIQATPCWQVQPFSDISYQRRHVIPQPPKTSLPVAFNLCHQRCSLGIAVRVFSAHLSFPAAPLPSPLFQVFCELSCFLQFIPQSLILGCLLR